MTANAAPEPQAFTDAAPPHTWLFYWETVRHQIANRRSTSNTEVPSAFNREGREARVKSGR